MLLYFFYIAASVVLLWFFVKNYWFLIFGRRNSVNKTGLPAHQRYRNALLDEVANAISSKTELMNSKYFSDFVLSLKDIQ